MYVITSTDRTSVHGLEVEVFFTLDYDVNCITTDINKAFKLSTQKEAEKLKHLLVKWLEQFEVVEIPSFGTNEK